MNDLRYAVRMLAKSPGYSAAALLVLALGLGGVTALFGTLHSIVLEPLPYDRPDRLVMGRATFDGAVNPMVAGPDYADYRRMSRSFSSLEAFFFVPVDMTVVADGRAERTAGQIATVGLLPTLGVRMAAGRPFTADEGRDGGPPGAVISHSLWQERFAGRPDLAGCAVTVDGIRYDVVGVTPPGFRFNGDANVWLPLRPGNLGPRRYNNFLVLGRLAEGVTLAQAQSEIDVVAAQLEKAYPDTNTGKGLLLTPLQGALGERYRSGFGLLSAGALAILLMAWANAAGLLVARGAGRRSELLVRTVMGASRWRIARLLLVEALLLAVGAGAAGTLLAVFMQRGLLILMPVDGLLVRHVGLSTPVLLFALAATLLTGAGVGVLPAWRVGRAPLAQGLRSGGRGSAEPGARVRMGLVAAQVAVSFVLLVLAGLLVRSFAALREAEPGFDHRRLLTAEIPLPFSFPDAQRAAFFSTLLERARALPGVVSAAAISQLPLRDSLNDVGIYAAENPPSGPADGGNGYQRVVLPGYFGTMGIPLLAGRDIQPSDTASSRRVVVISRRLAETLFPGRSPLGRAVVIDATRDATWEVVGVVADVKQDHLRQDARDRGSFYRAYGQQTPPSMRLAIRTAQDPLAIVPALRRLLAEMDPEVPLAGPRTMESVMADSTLSERSLSAYLAAFSALAVTLAAVGLYGLLAYVVARRQRETGIRMALGAQPAAVARTIVVEAVTLGALGLAAGVPASLAVGGVVRDQLYGVRPFDPLTLVGAAVLLLVVAAAAASLPARRAACLDPCVALRHD